MLKSELKLEMGLPAQCNTLLWPTTYTGVLIGPHSCTQQYPLLHVPPHIYVSRDALGARGAPTPVFN